MFFHSSVCCIISFFFNQLKRLLFFKRINNKKYVESEATLLLLHTLQLLQCNWYRINVRFIHCKYWTKAWENLWIRVANDDVKIYLNVCVGRYFCQSILSLQADNCAQRKFMTQATINLKELINLRGWFIKILWNDSYLSD